MSSPSVRGVELNTQTLEQAAQQWRFAADSIPQLICLVDREGRVLRANRTIERWQLGKVGAVRGLTLHDILHKHCADADCPLRLFWPRTTAALATNRRAQYECFDPVLGRHFQVRTELPVRATLQEGAAEDFFALITVDDIAGSGTLGRNAMQASPECLAGEAQKQLRMQKAQAHFADILDKTPVVTAMADANGALYYINAAGRKLFALDDDDDLSGMTLLNCQAASAVERIAGEALPSAERDGVWSGDSVLLSRDGRQVHTYLTLVAHRDARGELEGFSLLARDMSEWLRIEEALRLTQIQLSRLAAQHLTIQETERRRIAVDLHDGLGQTLSLVKLSIEEAASSFASRASDSVVKALERLTPQVKTALAELRRISMNLRPSTLDDLGIVATLSWYFREFEAACPGMKVERAITAKESEVPNPLKIAIFRIVQEATSNALKHARADAIKVSLASAGGHIELSIEDNGCGFDPASVAEHRDFNHGVGLQSMKERAELSGGRYDLRSVPAKGTRIRVQWPLTESQERAGESTYMPLIAELRKPFESGIRESFSACLACIRRFEDR
jgi:PAS domain S-box-containing protein